MLRSWLYRFGALFFLLAAFAIGAPAINAAPPAQMGAFPSLYYNHVDKGGAECNTNGAVASGYDTEIWKFWPEGTSPIPGVVHTEHYMVCWNGSVYFPTAGTYTVYTQNDDGMNVWINGAIAMNAWYDQGPTFHQGDFYIPGPGNYSFEVKYYNRTLGAVACVSWGLKGQSYPWKCPYPGYQPPPPPPCAYYPNCNPPPPPPPCAYYPNCNQPYPPPPQPCQYYPDCNQPYPPPPPPPCWQNPNCYQPPPPPPPPKQQCYYRIQYGDTLYSIAARFGVTVWQLEQWNNIYNPNLIYAGMVIRVC